MAYPSRRYDPLTEMCRVGSFFLVVMILFPGEASGGVVLLAVVPALLIYGAGEPLLFVVRGFFEKDQ